MTVRRIATPVRRVSAGDVIATSMAGIMDGKERPSLDFVNATPVLPASVLDIPGVSLGDPVTLSLIQGLGDTALNQAMRETAGQRPLSAVPTADHISHTSFKSGSKCIIQIVPRAGGSSRISTDASVVDQSFFFDKASLQATSESNDEKYQIFEGFDASILFLFGRRPRVWNFQFFVLNGSTAKVPASIESNEELKAQFIRRHNMDFADELERRYDRYYRGSEALKRRAVCVMTFEDRMIECTLVGMMHGKNANQPALVSVGLTFVVHETSYFGDQFQFNTDQTLASLLGTERELQLRGRLLGTSSIQPAEKTDDQKIAEVQATDAGLESIVDRRDSLQESVVAGLKESATLRDEIKALQDILPPGIENTTGLSPSERAARERFVSENRAKLARAESDLQALQDSMAKSQEEADIASEQVVAATAAFDAAVASAGSTPDGRVLTRVVEVVSTDESGRRLLEVYELEPDGSGTDLESAAPVSIRDVTDDPDYDAVADGSISSSDKLIERTRR